MKYKKITFACVLLGLSLYAGVCAATVREMADEAPASKQTIIADKKDKKLLNKKQRAVQITQEKDKIVVSTKPVAKTPAGTIKVPAAPRPSLLQEKDGKFYFSGTQLPDDYRNIAIYGEAIASKAQAIAYILAANPAVKLAREVFSRSRFCVSTSCINLRRCSLSRQSRTSWRVCSISSSSSVKSGSWKNRWYKAVM